MFSHLGYWMKKKFQIFVSSTYTDLREERSRIFETILAMGNIPVGMESFFSTSESSAAVIRKFLDQCDYQITIIGTRYGSILESAQISFTEMEYDYANSIGMPQLAFIQQHKGRDINGSEPPEQLAHLSKFRDKVRQRQCAFWETAAELVLAVSIALPKEIVERERPGWVRTTELESLDLQESKRLASELAGVRGALDRYRRNIVENNRRRFESGALPTPNLSGMWQCQEKATTIELREYAGAIVSHFATGTHEHWLHGTWSPEGKEAQIQIWRRERAPIAGSERRTTLMFGRFYDIEDDFFRYEMFASDGKADLQYNFVEHLTWRRLAFGTATP